MRLAGTQNLMLESFDFLAEDGLDCYLRQWCDYHDLDLKPEWIRATLWEAIERYWLDIIAELTAVKPQPEPKGLGALLEEYLE